MDEEIGKTVDPMIGFWLIDYSNDGTTDFLRIKFNADGNLIQRSYYERGVNRFDDTIESTWKNQGNDISSLNQTYIITEDDGSIQTFEFTYSEDFNNVSFFSDEAIICATRLSEDGSDCIEDMSLIGDNNQTCTSAQN